MIGTRCSTVGAFPWIRPGLAAVLAPATPKPRRALRQFNGKNAVSRPATGIDDALILEIRRLYEQIGLPPLKIHALITELGYDKTLGWVRQTTQFYNRSHLVPTLGAASYL
jgi:hypothetical protein